MPTKAKTRGAKKINQYIEMTDNQFSHFTDGEMLQHAAFEELVPGFLYDPERSDSVVCFSAYIDDVYQTCFVLLLEYNRVYSCRSFWELTALVKELQLMVKREMMSRAKNAETVVN